MAIWNDAIATPVPKDGRMYRVKSTKDRGFAWWAAEQRTYGWVAEGDHLQPPNILWWAEFETVETPGAVEIIAMGMSPGLEKALAAGGISTLPGYPFLPCPICKGTEGCDHSILERAFTAAGMGGRKS